MTKDLRLPTEIDMYYFKLLKHLQAQFAWMLALVLLMDFVFGCSSKASRFAAKAAEVKKFDRDESQLFSQYFVGNLEQARQSLKQTIEYIEKSNALDEDRQAGALALMNYRLFVLEKRAGHDVDAEIALVEARFWVVKNCELNRLTNSEIVDRLRNDTERSEKYVDEFDRGGNDGNKPRYLQYITNHLNEPDMFTNVLRNANEKSASTN
jgi:hypothetical protein